MRRETKAEREAWSKHFGDQAASYNKYGVAPKEERGKYASKHEATVAGNLAALERGGKIKDLQEQVRVVLVPKNGKLRSIVWVADFVYTDPNGDKHYLDAKGVKTTIYRLKKTLAGHMLGITIEEV